MAAIQQTIPNLLGGVSQQPDDIKLPGQVRAAENVLLDPTFGCMKRPPTQWVAALGSDIPSDCEWFPIFRDNTELYIAAVYRDPANQALVVRVWSVSGTEITVNTDPSFDEYVGESPVSALRYLTVADYTLLANTEHEPTVDTAAFTEVEDALIMVETISYNTTYNIDLAGPQSDTVTKTRATKLSISPSSWERNHPDCQLQAATTFQINYDDAPIDTNDEDAEGLVSTNNSIDNLPVEGTGLNFRIVTQCRSVLNDKDNYYSRYSTEVILYNGGADWRVGDVVRVQMANKDYFVRVEEVSSYDVYANHASVSYTSPANSESGGLSLDDVVTGLTDAVNNINGYNYAAESVNNVIRIYRTNNKPFIVSTRGGQSGASLTALRKTAPDVSKLPAQCFDDYRLKVANTEEATSDDYYVKFKSDQEGYPGPGVWEETVKIGEEEFLNKNSMPFAMIREATGTFSIKPLDDSVALGGWAKRSVGDSNTNPTPSFVGNQQTIRAMFLHRNRLGFVTQDACVMSQPGDFFNFYAVSGITISDADPIDISASDTKPVSLKDAISTSQGVILLGEQAQFSLGTEEAIFSANTAEMKKVSGYDYLGKVLPQHTGVSVMYATSAGEFTKVMELAVQSIRSTPITEETTRAVPRYIPTDLDWSACSPNNDVVLFGKKGDGVYVFRFFNEGDTRKVAGWSKWTFAGSIEFASFKGDDLYLVQLLEGEYQLLKMTLIDGPNSQVNVGYTQFRPRCDMQVLRDNLTKVSDVTQPNGDVDSIYELPTNYMYDDPVIVAYTDVRTGEYITTPVDNNQITIDSQRDFTVGVTYNGKVELPKFWVQPDPNKQRADHVSPPMVQNVYMDLFNSGAIECNLAVRGYPTQSFPMEITDADDYAADEVVVLENVTYQLPVYQRGDYVNITLNSVTPFPTAVTSYSWQGTYNKRGYRIL